VIVAAQPGGRHRRQAFGGYGRATPGTYGVGAIVQPGQGLLDIIEFGLDLLERGQRLRRFHRRPW
jgi:hypothetical protein